MDMTKILRAARTIVGFAGLTAASLAGFWQAWAVLAEIPMLTAALTLISLAILWVLYVSTMTIKHRIDRERQGAKRWAMLIPCYIMLLYVGVPGVLMDALFQRVFARYLFPGDKTRSDEWVLTERLRRLADPENIDRRTASAQEIANHERAIWICRYLVEPWDYNHCHLAKMAIAPA